MSLIELLVCAFLILTSAFMSASEIALFSLSRFQIRSLKEHVQPSTHRRIKRLLQDPGGLLITLLVVNEVINISLSAFITESIVTQSGGTSSGRHWLVDLLLGTSITTTIVLLACEVTPKAVGAKANQLIASVSAKPLSFVYDVLKPVRFVLTRFVELISRKLKSTSSESAHETASGSMLKESEFLMLVEEGHKEGAIHQSELEMIKNVFDLDDTRVDSIITPLAQVHSLPLETPIKTALATMRSNRYSRIPITTANRRQIVGILYTKDMLRAKIEHGMLTQPVSELIRKPLVVHPSMQLNALFRKFKQNRNHMAVVQKPTGETLGIVTMNDVLESLFGELLPEEDAE